MVSLKRLRQFAGRLAWVVNLLPQRRWIMQQLWATIAEETKHQTAVATGDRAPRQARSGRP
eukprot:7993437-Heterocapsa_arctica.AAC.1